MQSNMMDINTKKYESRTTWMIEDGWLDNTGNWCYVPITIAEAIAENSDSVMLEDCEITKELLRIKNLRRLYIYTSDGIPNWITQIATLEELVINGARDLQGFFNNISSLRNLKKIGFIGTNIENLLDTLVDLKNLEEIIIQGSDLTSDLPDVIGKLQNLQAIGLPYETFDLDKTFSILSNCKKLKYLFINPTTSDTLPSSISNIENLEYLDCFDWRNLKKLPDSLPKLKKLKAIDLGMDCNRGWNEQLIFPESFGEIKSLEYLNLMYRLNIELPKSFSKLDNLVFLDLCCSDVYGLPLVKEQCKNLVSLHLNIEGNKFFNDQYYYELDDSDITQYGLRKIFPRLNFLLCNNGEFKQSIKGKNAEVDFEGFFSLSDK